MRALAIFCVLLSLLALVELKKFTRCELAKEIIRQGLPGSIKDWVCLIEGESARNTAATNDNTNGSRDYGLFQINDAYWCSSSNPNNKSNDCKIKCTELLTDDITVASNCAKIIYKRHQFTAWNAWKKNCQIAANLPDLAKECNITTE